MMNIESAKAIPLASGVSSVDTHSNALNNSAATASSFSGTLDVKMGQLTPIQAVPVPTNQAPGVQVGVGLTVETAVTLGTVEMQNVAAAMGNNLPPTYKIKDEAGHAAALAAVTETLKYMTTGTTAQEKLAAAAKNLKDVIAMTVPVVIQQGVKDPVTLPVAKSSDGGVAAQLVKNIEGVVSISDKKITGEAIAPAVQSKISFKTISYSQPASSVVIPSVQLLGQVSSPANTIPASEQNTLNQVSAKPEKKKNEVVQPISIDVQSRNIDGIATPMNVPLMSVSQMPTAIKTGNTDVINTESVPAFIKSSNDETKSIQILKSTEVVPQNGTFFGQTVQGKEDLNLKYFEGAVFVDKNGRVDLPNLGGAGEKNLSQMVGADLSQLNKPIADSKIEALSIAKPLTHPEWNKDLGERIVWMSSKAIPSAEIKLNPQHLGPISVRVDVSDDQATVIFTAQHGATRDAIEASIPKLREMMSLQQLNLVDVSVSQNPGSDQGRSQAQNFFQSSGGFGQMQATGDVADADVEQEIASGRASVTKGLLSIYA